MKKLITFVLIAFGFSWAIAAVIYSKGGLSHALAVPLMFLYMCGPAVGAIICAALFDKGHRFASLGLKGGMNRWLIWSWVIAIFGVLGALLISVMPAGVELQNPMIGVRSELESQGVAAPEILNAPFMWVVIVGQAAIIGALINSVLLLSEELGWRGWLWGHLRGEGFWKATWIIGFLWGVWHIPIILLGHNYPEMPVLGAGLFVVFCLLFSPIFSYVREKSGSVWAASVLHGTFNALAGVALMAQTPTDMPWRGCVGIGGFAVMSILTIFVWSKMKQGERHA